MNSRSSMLLLSNVKCALCPVFEMNSTILYSYVPGSLTSELGSTSPVALDSE